MWSCLRGLLCDYKQMTSCWIYWTLSKSINNYIALGRWKCACLGTVKGLKSPLKAYEENKQKAKGSREALEGGHLNNPERRRAWVKAYLFPEPMGKKFWDLSVRVLESPLAFVSHWVKWDFVTYSVLIYMELQSYDLSTFWSEISLQYM